MKNVKLQQIELIKGIKLKGRIEGVTKYIITRHQVDELEFANTSWVKVVNAGHTTYIPTTNISQIVEFVDATPTQDAEDDATFTG